MKTTLRRVLGESTRPVRGRPLARVIGEDAQGEEADFRPPDPTPSTPPQAETPTDSNYPSMADLNQRKGSNELNQAGYGGALNSVLNMWRSGNRYAAADYMLKSNFLYTDLVRLLQMLPGEEALEVGALLDELAPVASPSEQPEDMVSAVAGPADMPQANSEPADASQLP